LLIFSIKCDNRSFGTAITIPLQECVKTHSDNHRAGTNILRLSELILKKLRASLDRAVHFTFLPSRPARRSRIFDLGYDKNSFVMHEKAFSDTITGHSLQKVDKGGTRAEFTTTFSDAFAHIESCSFEFGETHFDTVGDETFLRSPVQASNTALKVLNILLQSKTATKSFPLLVDCVESVRNKLRRRSH
jgi:hypothetical protein